MSDKSISGTPRFISARPTPMTGRPGSTDLLLLQTCFACTMGLRSFTMAPPLPTGKWTCWQIRVVHPDPSTWLRVDRSRQGSPGQEQCTWDYILAFGCIHGNLVRLFHYSSEGVSLKHLDDQSLQIYQSIWDPDDAHCCPAGHIELSEAPMESATASIPMVIASRLSRATALLRRTWRNDLRLQSGLVSTTVSLRVTLQTWWIRSCSGTLGWRSSTRRVRRPVFQPLAWHAGRLGRQLELPNLRHLPGRNTRARLEPSLTSG